MSLDTASYKQALDEERGRIVGAIENLHRDNPATLEDESQEPAVDQHLADAGTDLVDREIDHTIEVNEEHLLAEIDAALGRIEAGSYGICVTCGQPIDEERLRALPWTGQCIDCRRKGERG